MHRDIKTENILLTGEGVLKLADFGLAAPFGWIGDGVSPTPRPLHYEVATLGYRAPELLCRGATHGPAIDMWSVGCVLAELLIRQNIFRCTEERQREGRQEEGQLSEIAKLLGSPVDPMTDPTAARKALGLSGLREEDLEAMAVPGGPQRLVGLSTPVPLWPGCSFLPGFPASIDPSPPQPWRAMHPLFAAASPLALDLLSRLLLYDPSLRLTADEALSHPFFQAHPPPVLPSGLLPRGWAPKK